MKFTEIYDKLKITDIQEGQFEEKLLNYEDFKLIWYISKGKEWNQKYFVTCSFDKKSLNFIKNNKISFSFPCFLQNDTKENFFNLKWNIEKYFFKYDLSKFGFTKSNFIQEFEKKFDFDEYTWTIKKYLWSETEVNIPLSINGSLVELIWQEAFLNKKLTKVIIPNSVIEIWYRAFSSNQLTKIEIPNSVTFIWNSAFSNNKLKNIIISDSLLEIWRYTFRWNKLEKVTFPDSIDSIEKYAFCNNPLKNIILKKWIQIEEGAFDYSCKISRI